MWKTLRSPLGAGLVVAAIAATALLSAPNAARADGVVRPRELRRRQLAVRRLAALLGLEPVQHQDRRPSSGRVGLAGRSSTPEPRRPHQLSRGRRSGPRREPDLLVHPRRPDLPDRVRVVRRQMCDVSGMEIHIPNRAMPEGGFARLQELRRLQRQRGRLGPRRPHDRRRPGLGLGVRLLGRPLEGRRRARDRLGRAHSDRRRRPRLGRRRRGVRQPRRDHPRPRSSRRAGSTTR